MATPADYFGETPPARVIGTEAECNIQLVGDATQSWYIGYAAIERAGYIAVGKFLDNGMGLYEDVGPHLEIDSAEALGPRMATAANAATVIVLNRIVEASGVDHGGVHRHSGTIIGDTERTNGYHESYLFPRELQNSPLFDTLMASHLTSDLYTLSGTLHHGYRLSQKVKGIGDPPITRQVERRTAHGNKPMAMIPPAGADSDTIGHHQWARLERRYADTGFSLTAQYLGFAAVSLVLRLIEHQDMVKTGRLMNSSFRRFALTAQEFIKDLSFTKTAMTLDGREITAMDYQEIVLNEVMSLAEKIELPEDEQQAIPLWQAMIQEFRNSHLPAGHYGRLLGLVDFAPRHFYLTRLAKAQGVQMDNNVATLLEANLTWDRVLPAGGAMTYWKKFPSPYVTEEEINNFVNTAPPTRAAVRAEMIHDGRASGSTWSTVHTNRGEEIHLDPTLDLRAA